MRKFSANEMGLGKTMADAWLRGQKDVGGVEILYRHIIIHFV